MLSYSALKKFAERYKSSTKYFFLKFSKAFLIALKTKSKTPQLQYKQRD